MGQELDPESPLYNAAEYIELRFAVDLPCLQAAIAQCMQEAEALCVRFSRAENEPLQTLFSEASAPVRWLDLSAEAEPMAAALSFMRRDAGVRFELTGGPIFRHALLQIGSEHTLWYFAAHHIALDGFGFALIQKRVSELYSAQVQGKQAKAASFGSLRSVVEEDLAYQSSPERLRDGAFFRQRLLGAPEPVSFSERIALSSPSSIRRSAYLAPSIKDRLSAVARAAGVSWVDAVIAAFAAYLGRATGVRELVLGLPVMGRTGSTSLRVPSMVMNIVPLRLSLAPDESFTRLVSQVRQEVRALMPHSRYRYEQLRRDLKRVGGGKRLFGPVVNVMPFDHGFRFAGHYAPTHNITAGPVEDLAVGVYAHADGRGPKIAFDANPACYSEAEVESRLAGFVAFLSEAVQRPEASLADLGLVASTEARSVLYGPELLGPAEDVVQRLRGWAARTPERIAVESETRSLSYRALLEEAETCAHGLLASGVEPGALVALAIPRSPESGVAMLGVLLAGAAYLPLDVGGPEARTLGLLEDAKPTLVLTSHGLPRALAEALATRTRVISLTELGAQLTRAASKPVLPEVSARDLAYVIYTSGSTGKPNGVMIERHALAHFVAAAAQHYGFSAQDRVLQFAPLHFDASVEEVFVTLGVGATLVLRSDEMVESIPRFLSLCDALSLSVLDLPTAFWHELAYYLEAEGCVFPPSVRTVIIGGEAALLDRVRRFQGQVGTDVRLFNTYGPTETTVVATAASLHELRLQDAVPIGLPLPGLQAVVLSAHGVPVRAGEVGELHLLGPALGRGYLGDAELTARRFVTLHLGSERERAYRSGDLAKVGQDGQLMFVGRLDDELKISGHRIDPQEIENVLLRHAGVLECAVVAQSLATGGKSLVAHVVASEPKPSLEALRKHAQAALPGPLVPPLFVWAERLPRSSSGKIDRCALRKLESRVTQVLRRPLSALEQTLCEIWEQVLGQRDLLPDDDFFERGGQSLQTIQVVSRLSKQLGREIPAALLFRHPSIAALAAALSGEASEAPDQEALLRADVQLAADVQPHARASESARGSATLQQVLLTGATGFVGVYLLSELLAQTSARVVCLVRAKDDAQAELRLREALLLKGLVPDNFAQRVVVHAADLALPRLGLDAALYAQLAAACDAIYHCGASVSLVRGYASIRGANVLGTTELLRLCARGKRKTFHHVSTLAAASGATGDAPEARVEEAPAFRDGYAQSKWVAEQLVTEAMARGIPAAVYRLGRVVGPRSTGYVNPQDIVWRLLRVGIRSGVLPNLCVAEPWTEVDLVARAIVSLSRGNAASRVYNLTPDEPVSLAQVFEWVQGYGYALSLCAMSEFRARVGQARDEGDAATLSFFDGQKPDKAHAEPRTQAVCSTQTREALAAWGIDFPSVDAALVHRYLDFCVSAGFLPPPQRNELSPEMRHVES